VRSGTPSTDGGGVPARVHRLRLLRPGIARPQEARRRSANARFEERDAAAREAGRSTSSRPSTRCTSARPTWCSPRSRTRCAGGVYLCVDTAASSKLAENLEHPLGPFLYTVSCMHCMTVSSRRGMAGTMWESRPHGRCSPRRASRPSSRAPRRRFRQQLHHRQQDLSRHGKLWRRARRDAVCCSGACRARTTGRAPARATGCCRPGRGLPHGARRCRRFLPLVLDACWASRARMASSLSRRT